MKPSVIVYSNNRVCLNGEDLSEEKSLVFLREHKISLQRTYPDAVLHIKGMKFVLFHNVNMHARRKPKNKKGK